MKNHRKKRLSKRVYNSIYFRVLLILLLILSVPITLWAVINPKEILNQFAYDYPSYVSIYPTSTYLSSSTVTFSWDYSSNVRFYKFYVGDSLNSNEYGLKDPSINTPVVFPSNQRIATITGLPIDGVNLC